MDGSSFYLNLPFGGIPELSSAQHRSVLDASGKPVMSNVQFQFGGRRSE